MNVVSTRLVSVLHFFGARNSYHCSFSFASLLFLLLENLLFSPHTSLLPYPLYLLIFFFPSFFCPSPSLCLCLCLCLCLFLCLCFTRVLPLLSTYLHIHIFLLPPPPLFFFYGLHSKFFLFFENIFKLHSFVCFKDLSEFMRLCQGTYILQK